MLAEQGVHTGRPSVGYLGDRRRGRRELTQNLQADGEIVRQVSPDAVDVTVR
jgi:hypothetical protein